MSETTETVTDTPAIKAPAKRKPAKKAKAKRAKPAPRSADRPVETADDLAGISATACPRACSAERCVISTVGICKHPFKTADNGCGPITMTNRLRARKLIKHQMIDLQG